MYSQIYDGICIKKKRDAINVSNILIQSAYNNPSKVNYTNVSLSNGIWIIRATILQRDISTLIEIKFQSKDGCIISGIPNDWVLDEDTAIQLASAIFKAVYKRKGGKRRPCKAYILDGMWKVFETLPRGIIGGSPEMIIHPKSCQILKIWYSK